jgi:hypothetical protein
LFAQQPTSNSPQTTQHCVNQQSLRPRLPAAPGRRLVQICKPVAPDTQRLSQSQSRNDDNANYITFDVPGAANGTLTAGINDGGVIAGYYVDAGYNYHGFLRDPLGSITSFDVPGDGGGTIVYAINNAGTATGNWCPDTTYTHCPGFVRYANGKLVSFDIAGDYYGAYPEAINPEGTLTGSYWDISVVAHGFVRTSNGAVTAFDAPGAVYGTFPLTINADGSIAGSYQDGIGAWHGFLRDRDGDITTFDVPGGVNTGEGAFDGGPAVNLNPEGEVAGSYIAAPNTYDGFLRHRDGTFDTFYAANYPPCCIWTWPTALNADDTIAGYQNDGYSINHGFIRTRDGDVTLFDVPGAGTGYFQGTVVVGMTAGRVIAGFYTDNAGLAHGFLRIPQ